MAIDPSAKKLAALQELWALYCSMYAQKGLDLSSWLTNLSEQKRQLAKQYGAEDCFDELCECGCQPKPLAIAMMIFQPLRSFERKWKQITGTPREREQKIRAMEKAATALEEVLSTLADVVIEHVNPGSSNLDTLKSVRRDLTSPPDTGLMWATATTVDDPATTIRALREYASLLKLCDLSQTDSGVGSADAFAKYLFSAYVYRATDQFHDAQVSTLIGAAIGTDYDETAHRMWRNRNYKRIDKNFSSIADLFTDFGIVSAT